VSSTSRLKKFSELPWESRFVEAFPGDVENKNFTRNVRNVCYSEVKPTPVPNPKLIGWSERLGDMLGISRPTQDDVLSLELLSGNRVLPNQRTYSARYGGHQFGNWAGQLGDGRAITLGEVVTPGVGRFEYQLKGAGPTPYSRRADGRAVLRSSIREFLCSEAMHFLGVPTTRALSIVSTGDQVIRDLFYSGNPAPEPGAIVCRVAPTFLRFGNFEILSGHQELDLLKKLTDFMITEHYKHLELNSEDVYGRLLDEIAKRTADMVSHWMRVGFVHGVMNTDNMSVLGLTIDYGPYGWLEPYDPSWTPNTTDAEMGRYRFGNQPSIAQWNLARLGEALFPLILNEERIVASLTLFQETFEKSFGQTLAQKLGFTTLESETDQKLVHDLFGLLQSIETDYTIFFRRLAGWPSLPEKSGSNVEEVFQKVMAPAFYTEDALPSPLKAEWIQWLKRYSEKVKRDGRSDEVRSTQMKKVNPKYVLRNYLAQNAIISAEKGDPSVMERLLRVLQTPYDELPSEEDLAARRPEWARNAPGCSALSCSS
jgi:serine/tyrosine/threonine adenylyltransferase